MAHGKSLELSKITRNQGSPVCICGVPFNDHRKKDGGLMKRFQNDSHRPIISTGLSRATRRKAGIR